MAVHAALPSPYVPPPPPPLSTGLTEGSSSDKMTQNNPSIFYKPFI